MTTTISFADWVDWLAIELTFVELYESASPSGKREMRAAIRRLAEGIDEAAIARFLSQVPDVERALSGFPDEERGRFASQLTMSVTELGSHVASLLDGRD